MVGSSAQRKSAPSDLPFLSHQDKINLEIFKAIEQLGRKIEKSDENRTQMIERLTDLEASTVFDDVTGRLYLPMRVDPAQLPKPQSYQPPGWMMASTVTSTAVACLALALVLFRDPVLLPLPEEQRPAQVASAPSVLRDMVPPTQRFVSGTGPNSGWKMIDLKTGVPAEIAAEQRKVKPLLRPALSEEDEGQDTKITGEMMVAEAPEPSAAEVRAIEPAAGEPEAVSVVPEPAVVAETSVEPEVAADSGLTSAEVAAIAPSVEETSAEEEAPLPVVEATPIVPKTVKAVTDTKPVTVTQVAKKEPVTGALPSTQSIPVVAAPSSASVPVLEVAAGGIQPDPSLPDDVKDLEKRAFEGIAEAEHDLATLYASGKLASLDYGRAFHWFKRAAQGGIANAHYNLGVMHHQGLGTAVDVNKAIRSYESAAELGHPEAMYNLGIAFVEGVGVDPDIARGVSYFRRASDAGIAQAAYNLGVLYESNFIGTIDTAKASEWYKKAAELGHAQAGEALARLQGESVPTGVADAGKPTQTAAALLTDAPETVEPAGGIGEGDMSPPDEKSPDMQLVARIQRLLIDKGFLPGKPSGALDDKTRDAILAWQKSAGVPVDGKPSQELLDFMIYSGKK